MPALISKEIEVDQTIKDSFISDGDFRYFSNETKIVTYKFIGIPIFKLITRLEWTNKVTDILTIVHLDDNDKIGFN